MGAETGGKITEEKLKGLVFKLVEKVLRYR